jgi:hypothetical protein
MATYYTSSTALGGGVGSYADPFTLQEAFDTATAGDEVRVLNDGTYSPTATIDVDTNQGTSSSPIVFVGRNSADTAEEVATISGTSILSGSVIYFNFGNTSHSYVHIKKLKFDGSLASNDISAANALNNRGVYWFDCIFTNSSRYALGSGCYFCQLIRCQFINNTSISLYNFKNSLVIGCYFESNHSGTNATNGIFGCTSPFYGCVFRNNGYVYSDMAGFYNCTFDGNNAVGKAMINTVITTPIINCVFANYTVTAIEASSADTSYYIQGCHFYNNVSDSNLTIDSTTNTLSGTDPQFTNTTNGTEDYTPVSGSPLIGAGQPSLVPNFTASDMTSSPTIGAIVPAASGGGSTSYALPPKHTRL